MRTTKPISTVSYNDLEFLIGILNQEIENHNITFYSLIKHEPEEDEKKVHYHVYIVPNRIIDTGVYQDKFNQSISNGIILDKPLKCMPFQSSKFYDWYMYNLHDIAYLQSKFETRKFHYTREDFITSDSDFLDELIKQNKCDTFALYQVLIEYYLNEKNFAQFIIENNVAPQMIGSLKNLWYELKDGKTNRNGRNGHENNV